MSDFSYSPRDHEMGVIPSIILRDHSQTYGYIPRKSIPWNVNISLAVSNFFQGITYPFRFTTEIPFEEPLRSEIRRFLISLDAYKESSNPVIPIRDILIGATLKGYSSYLKKVRRKSFLTTWMADLYEQPSWWNDVPAYHINDIGDIFNYAYLIFWEEDYEDDYIYGRIPVKITQSTLEEFREQLKDILSEVPDLSEVSEIEVLSTLSSSISINESLENKPHYRLKTDHLSFSKKRGICKRCVIRVSPENTRDTILSQVEDLNRISLIEKQTMDILRYIPGHIHLNDPQRVQKRLDSLGKKYFLFLHRDIKKEGITKPRELLKVMLEELKLRFPKFKAYEAPDFYDSFILSHDGIEEPMLRGHGLGMANSLTTLMQITIHKLIMNRLWNDIPDLECKILCLNDDFVAGFHDVSHLDAYWELEGEVLNELSILRQPDKSFSSQRLFVLAERYYTPSGFYKKESYQRRELLLPYACYNITHAKQYFSAAQVFCQPEYARCYIAELGSYWGYEFFPDEFRYPSIFGGWISDNLNGIDLSLMFLDQPHNETYAQRGYNASQVRMTRKPRGKSARVPIQVLFGFPKIPSEFSESFDILTTYQLDDKYGRRFDDPRYFSKYWDSFYKRRQMAFKRAIILPFSIWLKKVLQDNFTRQFYPCKEMIQSFLPATEYRVKISDPYIDPNPRMAALSKWGNLSYPFSETFSIRFTNKDATTKKSESIFSKEVQRTLKNEVTASYMTGTHFAFIWPSESTYDPSEQYINPIGIGEISSYFNWGFGYPKLREEYRHPLIEEKREIFSRFLSLQELIWISLNKIPRIVIKKLIQVEKLTKLDLKIIWDTLIEIETEDLQNQLELDIPVELTPERMEEEEGEEPALSAWRHTFESTREVDPQRIYIARGRLFEQGCPFLWSHLHLKDQNFSYEDDFTMQIYGELRLFTSIITNSHILNPKIEEIEFKIRRFKKTYISGSYILRVSGVEEALLALFTNETPDVSDAMGDLFG